MIDERILERLAAMPRLVALAADALAREQQSRGPGAAFSLAEHAWHLADLEREGYGARIVRILAEERPSLPDFDGDRAARERDYQSADVALGIRLFQSARARNLERLRSLPPASLSRGGVQDGVGPITLSEIPLMMAHHDRAHAAELADLLTHLGARPDAIATLRHHAEATLPSSHPAAA